MSRKMINALKQLYSPMSYMKKRYPKASKKRRIIKKWAKRFGTDNFEIAKVVYSKNPFLDFIGKVEPLMGQYFSVPIVFDTYEAFNQPHLPHESDESHVESQPRS